MNNTQTPSDYDVILSGAGPVGLFLACELALAHCSVLILEKAENPQSPLKQLPPGIRGLSAPTIEALNRRGFLDQLETHQRLKNPHQNAKTGTRRQAGHFAGIPFHDGDIDTSRWEYRLPGLETSLIAEMQELETVLARRAQALGVTIKRGFGVTDYRQTDDEVEVLSGAHSFHGRWLVGCDGARSVVRKLGGFEFAGTEPEFTGYTVLADLSDGEKLSPGRNVTPSGMYMQSQPGYLMIQDFDGGAFHTSNQPITLEHVQAVLRRVSQTDVTVSELRLASTWTDRARQATAYRNGRVFLAGDAAHIHAPLGGQGLNLGLGDAINLGWKLAAAVHNQAPEGLLDSYFTERYPVGIQVLDWSRAQAAIMKSDPAARALHAIFRDLIETRDGATYFAGRVRAVHLQYPFGGDHPLVGRGVPLFQFDDGTTIDQHLHGGKAILLDFEGRPPLKALANEYGDQVRYISSAAKEHFDLKAVLIRPDGFVAWAADNELDEASLKRTAARWFAASS